MACLNNEQLEEGTNWRAGPDWSRCLPIGTQSCICATTPHTTLVVAVGPQSHKVCHWFYFARASDSGEAAADLYVATPRPSSWRGCRQAFSNKHSITDCLQVAAVRQHFIWHSQQKHSHCSAMVCWLAWAKMLTLPYEPEAWNDSSNFFMV